MEIVVGLLAALATALVVVGGTVYVVTNVLKHSKAARWIGGALVLLTAACAYYVYTRADAPPDQDHATPDGRIRFSGPPGVLIVQPKENDNAVVYEVFREKTLRDEWNLDPARTRSSNQTPPGMVHFMTIIEDTNTENPNVAFDDKIKSLVSGWIDNHNGHSPVTKEGVATIDGMPARYVELRRDYERSTTYTVMYAIDAGTSYVTVIGHKPYSAVHAAVNTMRVIKRAATRPAAATTNS